MEGLDKKLPDFRHGFESAAAERVGVDGNAAPADDTETLGVGSGFDGGPSFVNNGSRKKSETDSEKLREGDSQLLGAGAEESLRKRREQTGTVAASSVGINAATMGEAP
jgi:hypothetical protein